MVESVECGGMILPARTMRIDGEDVLYVALRPVVDALGLGWPSQYRKVKDREWGFGTRPTLEPAQAG
jgi:hypothetical protein